MNEHQKSTHRVEVIRVHLEPHPNADSLSIVRPWGYTVIVRTADWQEGALGAYVVPDSIVDVSRPEFAFLEKGHERVRVRRFRGVVSQGLLVPAPAGAQEGDDVAEVLGVTRYEPPIPGEPGQPRDPNCPRRPSSEAGPAPPGIYPVYDVDAWHRYGREVLTTGEPIHVSEKIHGANLRVVWRDGRLWIGSRNEWKRADLDPAKCMHLDAVRSAPWLAAWCEAHPGYTVYGEAFGRVADLRYGRDGRDVLVFDVLDPSAQWLDVNAARTFGADLHWVPTIFMGCYDESAVAAFADGPSLVPGADHVREGCVVKPLRERTHQAIGRVILKIVGNSYYERKER